MDEKTKELVEAAERHAEQRLYDDAEVLFEDITSLCAIVREQAAQLERLASATKVGAGETLVLIADEGTTGAQRMAAAEALYEVHPSPIIVLPHGWSTIPVDELRKALERSEAKDNG